MPTRQELSLIKNDRPPCPECKGNDIISYGDSWKCIDCNRKWLKNRRTPILEAEELIPSTEVIDLI